ncbi:DUF3027 domain-containing protein [Deinococcus roseus]|uniref:Uncharacterized protein n=1 Tax=Deinococcus roseus TaxID=392414 RepID=A0ABQ2DH30_9DEIO|nr:DUF3027 domain-containing protein [Deinococcus roseus]GGJ57793.1 hypothetical protein GCM10008938_49860 [Deinococcus roseus]
MKKLKTDNQHFRETHRRWISSGYHYENIDSEDIRPQCMDCIFYIELTGKFAADWGVCSNVLSPADRLAVFEHDGCEFQVEAEE